MYEFVYRLSLTIQHSLKSTEEERLKYEHGLRVIYQLLEKTLLCVLAGFLFGYGILTIVTLVAMIAVKSPLGGMHFKSSALCLISTASAFVFVMWLSIVVNRNISAGLLVYVVSCIGVLIFHKYKTTEESKSVYARTRKAIAIVVPAVVMIATDYSKEGMVFAFTLGLSAVMLTLTFLINKKRGTCNEKD